MAVRQNGRIKIRRDSASARSSTVVARHRQYGPTLGDAPVPASSQSHLDRYRFCPGIGVSHHQQAVYWPAIAASGVHFCFIKSNGRIEFRRSALRIELARRRPGGNCPRSLSFLPSRGVGHRASEFIFENRGAARDRRSSAGARSRILAGWNATPLANRTSLVLSWLDTIEQAM